MEITNETLPNGKLRTRIKYTKEEIEELKKKAEERKNQKKA